MFRFRVLAVGCFFSIPALTSWVQAQELLPPGPEIVATGDPESEMEDQEGVETLLRGPLHEAFAESFSVDAVPGLIIEKEPPAPIDEIPPEYRPEGEEMIWIPGYWGWDEERKDFLWISGVYRVPPVGQRWVPGYWQGVDQGWQWIPGFWIAEEVETLSYLVPPPASLEQGPSSPSPGSQYFYIPGHWNHGTTGYRWQTGYWYPASPQYVWIPPRYIWTPMGCIFVNGYFDERLSARGLCFAPAYISHSVYSRPNFYYRPRILLNTNTVFHNLFICPRYHHYMFGDYFGDRYISYNIRPVHTHHLRYGQCDPLMSFYSSYYARQGRDLNRWYTDYHQTMRMDQARRPPSSWQQILLAKQSNAPLSLKNDDWIADSLQSIVKEKKMPNQWSELNGTQRDLLKRSATEFRELSTSRGKIEKKVIGPAGADSPKPLSDPLNLGNQGTTGTPVIKNHFNKSDVASSLKLPSNQPQLTLGKEPSQEQSSRRKKSLPPPPDLLSGLSGKGSQDKKLPASDSRSSKDPLNRPGNNKNPTFDFRRGGGSNPNDGAPQVLGQSLPNVLNGGSKSLRNGSGSTNVPSNPLTKDPSILNPGSRPNLGPTMLQGTPRTNGNRSFQGDFNPGAGEGNRIFQGGVLGNPTNSNGSQRGSNGPSTSPPKLKPPSPFNLPQSNFKSSMGSGDPGKSGLGGAIQGNGNAGRNGPAKGSGSKDRSKNP